MVCGASGDLSGAKGGAETVLSLTGLDEVKAHVERELGVSDRQLGVSDWRLGISDRQPVTQGNPDAFAQ
jgi:hypothetical protein